MSLDAKQTLKDLSKSEAEQGGFHTRAKSNQKKYIHENDSCYLKNWMVNSIVSDNRNKKA